MTRQEKENGELKTLDSAVTVDKATYAAANTKLTKYNNAKALTKAEMDTPTKIANLVKTDAAYQELVSGDLDVYNTWRIKEAASGAL